MAKIKIVRKQHTFTPFWRDRSFSASTCLSTDTRQTNIINIYEHSALHTLNSARFAFLDRTPDKFVPWWASWIRPTGLCYPCVSYGTPYTLRTQYIYISVDSSILFLICQGLLRLNILAVMRRVPSRTIRQGLPSTIAQPLVRRSITGDLDK